MDLEQEERETGTIEESGDRDGAKHGEGGPGKVPQHTASARSGIFGKFALAPAGRKRVRTFSLALVVVFSVGLGITQGWHWMNREVRGVPEGGKTVSPGDNLSEERLSPFYVPLPPEGSTQAVAVDFSVIWDGVTSFRFKKMELKIRNRLYEFMVDFAKRKDLKEKASLLETEMGRIFKESLGTEKLAVKIEEIKAL